GIDLVLDAVPRLLERRCEVVLLGSGEPRYESALRELAARFPGRVAARIGFDLPLSHLVEAGADFFLMPSLYEPCGLNQMYSLRYGTLPIVRATGGLEDTVTDLADPEGTGIKFIEFSPEALLAALQRALDLYGQPRELAEVRKRAMAADHSWDASARSY